MAESEQIDSKNCEIEEGEVPDFNSKPTKLKENVRSLLGGALCLAPASYSGIRCCMEVQHRMPPYIKRYLLLFSSVADIGAASSPTSREAGSGQCQYSY